VSEIVIEPIDSFRLRREYPQLDLCPGCLDVMDGDPLHMAAILPDGHISAPRVGKIGSFPDLHLGILLEYEVALCGTKTVYSLHLTRFQSPLYLWSWDYLSTWEGKCMLFNLFRSHSEMEGKLLSISTISAELLMEYALEYVIVSSVKTS